MILTGAVITAGFSFFDDGIAAALSTLMFFVFVVGGGFMVISGFIAYRIASKMMGFVQLAEGIFQGFDWTDVKNIDLPAITKKGKQPGDPGALGVLYFRY